MAYFEFGGLHDLVAGDVVTLSGHDMEINYTVQNLTVTEANADANIVSGTSDPYETVYVWQHEPGPQLPFEVNEDGEWLADLSGYYDIHPGSSGRSEIRDKFGNATAVDWRSPNTRFTVFPEWNYLEGYEWPDGATVSISVIGKEACLTEAVSGFPEWDPWNTFFSVNFPEGCDAVVGDIVTLTDNVPLEAAPAVVAAKNHAVDLLARTLADVADPKGAALPVEAPSPGIEKARSEDFGAILRARLGRRRVIRSAAGVQRQRARRRNAGERHQRSLHRKGEWGLWPISSAKRG